MYMHFIMQLHIASKLDYSHGVNFCNISHVGGIIIMAVLLCIYMAADLEIYIYLNVRNGDYIGLD